MRVEYVMAVSSGLFFNRIGRERKKKEKKKESNEGRNQELYAKGKETR